MQHSHCYAHKLPLPVIVLEIMSNEGHIRPPQFFLKSLKINVTVYIKILLYYYQALDQEVALEKLYYVPKR